MTRYRIAGPVAIALAMAGCGPEFPMGEVEGTLTHRGKPVPMAVVEFHPTASRGPSSRAETDEQGRFHLRYSTPTSNGEINGALVGGHKVIVLDLKNAADGDGSLPRFSVAYMQLATTPLTREVKPGRQTIDVSLD